jgi:hypothetical protein
MKSGLSIAKNAKLHKRKQARLMKLSPALDQPTLARLRARYQFSSMQAGLMWPESRRRLVPDNHQAGRSD